MGELFKGFLVISLSAGAIALVLLAVRAVLGRFMKPAACAVLWAVLILRLILPVSIESPTSVYNLIRADFTAFTPAEDPAVQQPEIAPEISPASYITETADAAAVTAAEEPSGERTPAAYAPQTTQLPAVQPAEIPLPQAPVWEAAAEQTNAAAAKTVPDRAAKTALVPPKSSGNPAPLDAWDIGGAVWIAGFILSLSIAAVVNGRFYRDIKNNRACAGEDFNALIAECRDELGIRQQIDARFTDRLTTPAVWGIFRPVLLIPMGFHMLGREKQRTILLHELCHIRHCDTFKAGAVLLLNALHWFNPLLWAAFKAMRRDMETACDCRALKAAGGTEEEYAATLISLAGNGRIAAANFLMAAMDRKKDLKRRIRMVMRFRKTKAFMTGVALLLAFAIAAAGCTSAMQTGNAGPAGASTAAASPAVIGPADVESAEISYSDASCGRELTAGETKKFLGWLNGISDKKPDPQPPEELSGAVKIEILYKTGTLTVADAAADGYAFKVLRRDFNGQPVSFWANQKDVADLLKEYAAYSREVTETASLDSFAEAPAFQKGQAVLTGEKALYTLDQSQLDALSQGLKAAKLYMPADYRDLPAADYTLEMTDGETEYALCCDRSLSFIALRTTGAEYWADYRIKDGTLADIIQNIVNTCKAGKESVKIDGALGFDDVRAVLKGEKTKKELFGRGLPTGTVLGSDRKAALPEDFDLEITGSAYSDELDYNLAVIDRRTGSILRDIDPDGFESFISRPRIILLPPDAKRITVRFPDINSQAEIADSAFDGAQTIAELAGSLNGLDLTAATEEDRKAAAAKFPLNVILVPDGDASRQLTVQNGALFLTPQTAEALKTGVGPYRLDENVCGTLEAYTQGLEKKDLNDPKTLAEEFLRRYYDCISFAGEFSRDDFRSIVDINPDTVIPLQRAEFMRNVNLLLGYMEPFTGIERYTIKAENGLTRISGYYRTVKMGTEFDFTVKDGKIVKIGFPDDKDYIGFEKGYREYAKKYLNGDLNKSPYVDLCVTDAIHNCLASEKTQKVRLLALFDSGIGKHYIESYISRYEKDLKSADCLLTALDEGTGTATIDFLEASGPDTPENERLFGDWTNREVKPEAYTIRKTRKGNYPVRDVYGGIIDPAAIRKLLSAAKAENRPGLPFRVYYRDGENPGINFLFSF